MIDERWKRSVIITIILLATMLFRWDVSWDFGSSRTLLVFDRWTGYINLYSWGLGGSSQTSPTTNIMIISQILTVLWVIAFVYVVVDLARHQLKRKESSQ